jgi:tetratricopeptide (TPR) repeat protein
MAAGAGDSDEADGVRDAMDKPWRHLSREEVARLKGLSADLYLLEDDERRNQADPGGRSPERLSADLNAAVRLQNWEEVLGLLRLPSTLSPPDRVALLRAAAYRDLGHLDAAILFLEYAAKIKPEVAEYEWSLVELLLKSKRFDAADTLAESWIKRSALPPALAIRAATVLVEAARTRPDGHGRALYERAIDLLQRALPGSTDLPPVFLVLGYLILGYCYQQLDEREEAARVYDEGLRECGDDPGLFMARGSLLVKTDRSAAIADFKRAVEGGAGLALPYVYVAHDALLHHDYQRCLDLCARILSLSQNGRVLAAAFQWTAIARYELGTPAEGVRQYFEAALDLDPLNEQIQQNLEIIKLLAQSGSTGPDGEARWLNIQTFDATLVPPEYPVNRFASLAA